MARKWWFFGLFWGAFMFVIMEVFTPMAEDEALSTQRLFLSLLYWLAVGVLLGWILDKIIKPKTEKKQANS